MLHGMSALVGSHGSSSNRIRLIHRITQVERLVGRIVVVGQIACHVGDAHILQPETVKHHLCHLCTRIRNVFL